MLLTSADWALRGATCARVPPIAAALLRDHGQAARGTPGGIVRRRHGHLCHHLGGWQVLAAARPLDDPPARPVGRQQRGVLGIPPVPLFDDSFRLRWWHVALWLLLVIAGTAGCLLSSRTLGLALTLSSFAFAVLAMAHAVTSWRDDLVERRRRGPSSWSPPLRSISGLSPWPNSPALQRTAPEGTSLGGAARPAGHRGRRRLVVAKRRTQEQSLFAVTTDLPRPVEEPPATAIEPGDQELVARLERLMTVERAHRQDGLTIGGLA